MDFTVSFIQRALIVSHALYMLLVHIMC